NASAHAAFRLPGGIHRRLPRRSAAAGGAEGRGRRCVGRRRHRHATSSRPAPPALPRLLPTTDPPARWLRAAEPSIGAGESIRVPVSGLSMRTNIIAACAAVTLVAFVLLMAWAGFPVAGQGALIAAGVLAS